MNTRANIMYFIEHFLDMAQRDGHPDYIRMMQRDIIRVVDAVAPDDRSGAANVRVVRKVSRPLVIIYPQLVLNLQLTFSTGLTRASREGLPGVASSNSD